VILDYVAPPFPYSFRLHDHNINRELASTVNEAPGASAHCATMLITRLESRRHNIYVRPRHDQLTSFELRQLFNMAVSESKSFSFKLPLKPTKGENEDVKSDEAACNEQLQSSLLESVTSALASRKPILTHLNADTSWLLSLPYPESKKRQGVTYFHILIDPWLKGGQSDVAGWFSQQWHVERSCVENYRELLGLIRDLEKVAKPGRGEGSGTLGLDLVIVSHEFTDHMHKDTLLDIDSKVPVLATAKAAGVIRGWKHFSTVGDVERFDGDWRSSRVANLDIGREEEWLGVSRVAYTGSDLLYYHSAVMITFSSSAAAEAQGVIYTPHGISPENLSPVASANPKIETLALLHGLQDIALPMGAQLNRGAHNGLKVQRMLGSRYWVGTHDEVKKGGGVVSWFLRRKRITLRDAMEREAMLGLVGVAAEKKKDAELGEVRFEELGVGESLVLD
jgi:hypothetical protein